MPLVCLVDNSTNTVLVFAFEHQRVGARKMSPVVASWKSQLHATSHSNAQRHLTTLIRNNTLQV